MSHPNHYGTDHSERNNGEDSGHDRVSTPGIPQEPGTVAPRIDHGDVVGTPVDTSGKLELREKHDKAAGLPAVLRSMQYTLVHAGVARTLRGLSVLNQKGGIDCMSCAWPEPDGDRSFAEFCENGAKALGHEMDRRKCGPDFFKANSVAELSTRSDFWLEQQGRLTHPMVLRAGATHYTPISWGDAFKLIGKELNALASPDLASFYTSGRASNEAAFLYQLFVRQFGTNNLPDCSNMCHESSGSALTPTIGIGKGTVTLEDFEKTQVIFILGQNPGTNHPRMLTTLQRAKKKGAKIVAINPLPEAGLLGFMNPQQPLGLLGIGSALADLFLQVRINGDMAVLKGMIKVMLEREDAERGSAFNWDFINEKTAGVEALIAHIRDVTWAHITNDSGLTREQITEAANLAIGADRFIFCWAMGLTQQPNSVQTIQEVVNVLLLRGSIGKPGAGACPVRGHSNVQGDRTMGIWEKPPESLLKKLEENFKFTPPREHGYDIVDSVKAMHQGKLKVFIQLGGNVLSAMSDTLYVQEGLSKLDLSVRIGTKLNRSDLAVGKQALILPCLGRSEIDKQSGEPQFITTENSMGVVEMSRGRIAPASKELRSEVAIIAGIAAATLGARATVDFAAWAGNYDLIRDAIAATIPGCDSYNQKVRKPGGFYLPNKARDNEYATENKKANFSVSELPTRTIGAGELLMMTIRSHDQFNTTIYGLHDRYRGVHNERRVIFMNEQDMADRQLVSQQVVDIASQFRGQIRNAPHFIVVPYSIPVGCCATYYPEGNALVPIDSVADKSNTPTSKFVYVTVAPGKSHEPFNYERVDGGLAGATP